MSPGRTAVILAPLVLSPDVSFDECCLEALNEALAQIKWALVIFFGFVLTGMFWLMLAVMKQVCKKGLGSIGTSRQERTNREFCKLIIHNIDRLSGAVFSRQGAACGFAAFIVWAGAAMMPL